MEQGVVPQFESVAADRALEGIGLEVLARQVLHGDFLAGADVAERMRGSGAVGIKTNAGGVDLQRRSDGEPLDQAGEFLGFQVVKQDVRQQELLLEVSVQFAQIDLFVAAQQAVDLVQVALDHLGAGNLLELSGRRPVAPGDVTLRLALAITADDFDVFGAEFAAQLVEIKRDGKPRTIAHEQAAVTVVDVAARSGHQDAALVLEALAFTVGARPEELPVGKAGRENQHHPADQEMKKQEARALRLVGFNDAQGAKARAKGGAAGRRTFSEGPVAFLGEVDPPELQRTLLKGEKPRSDGHDEELGPAQIGKDPQPGGAGRGMAAQGHEGEAENERQVGQQRDDHADHRLLARNARPEAIDDDVHHGEKQEMRAEGHRLGRINAQPQKQRGGETVAQAQPQGGEGHQQPADK